MLTLWIEEYLYEPKYLWQKLLSFLLLPFSYLNCFYFRVTYNAKKEIDYDIKVISVGNIILGGTGKTPFIISLARSYYNVAIVLRGYKREGTELVIVSRLGTVLCDVKTSGDEAMLYARNLHKATVIVSNDRVEGILKAKELGCEAVFLDDGFRHKNIKRLNILLRPNKDPKNSFCLPSGGYKAPISYYKSSDITAKEGLNFRRSVTVKNQTPKMILVTAIARPLRLDPYLPKVIDRFYFRDHYSFDKNELTKIFFKSGATSILTTEKDAVKMVNFGLPLSILKLDMSIDKKIKEAVDNYIFDDPSLSCDLT